MSDQGTSPTSRNKGKASMSASSIDTLTTPAPSSTSRGRAASLTDFLTAVRGSTKKQQLAAAYLGKDSGMADSDIAKYLGERGEEFCGTKTCRQLIKDAASAVSIAHPLFQLEDSLVWLQPGEDDTVDTVNTIMLGPRATKSVDADGNGDLLSVLLLDIAHSLAEEQSGTAISHRDLTTVVKSLATFGNDYSEQKASIDLAISAFMKAHKEGTNVSFARTPSFQRPTKLDPEVQKAICHRLKLMVSKDTPRARSSRDASIQAGPFDISRKDDVAVEEFRREYGQLTPQQETEIRTQRNKYDQKQFEAWSKNYKRYFKQQVRRSQALLDVSKVAKNIPVYPRTAVIVNINDFANLAPELSEEVSVALRRLRDSSFAVLRDHGASDSMFSRFQKSHADPESKHFWDTIDQHSGFIEWDINLGLIKGLNGKEVDHERAGTLMTVQFLNEYNSNNPMSKHSVGAERSRPTEYLTVNDPDFIGYRKQLFAHGGDVPAQQCRSLMSDQLREKLLQIEAGNGASVLLLARDSGDRSKTMASYLSDKHLLVRAKQILIDNGLLNSAGPAASTEEWWQKSLPRRAWEQLCQKLNTASRPLTAQSIAELCDEEQSEEDD